jgi:hypothetical protein
MDREVMMREAFGVREACFRSVKLSDEPYVRRGSSPPKSEMLPIIPQPARSALNVQRLRCRLSASNEHCEHFS